MRRVLLFIFALLLAACGRNGLERLAPGEVGRVVEVTSGDSLTLDTGLQVRLAGIEAPWGDEPFAAEARAGLARLAEGKRVQLLYGGARRSKYGRALAQVKLTQGDLWLEQALLRRGLARVRTWADNRAMAPALLEDEAYARNRGLGLWRLPRYRVLLPRETEGAPGFQIVEGRVRRTTPGDDAVSLEFMDGAGERFTAAIDPKAIGDFETVGKAPGQLVGEPVRLRGPIRYGPDGPVMRLDHPEQVELLKGG